MSNDEDGGAFADIRSLEDMDEEEAIKKLDELGETDLADAVRQAQVARSVSFGVAPSWWERIKRELKRTWLDSNHLYGFLPVSTPSQEKYLDIMNASTMEPDMSLKNARIKITLNRLMARDYPGSGVHNIMVSFAGLNQAKDDKVEFLRYNQVFRVREGQFSGAVGYPIFIGLSVGSNGVAFEVATINVNNDDDEAFLRILESDELKNGLKLLSVAQPAILPLSSMAKGMASTIAERNRNIKVQDIMLGLDFTGDRMAARIAEGSYIAVQVPSEDIGAWSWNDWVLNTENGLIVRRDEPKVPLDLNHLVFGLTRYQEE